MVVSTLTFCFTFTVRSYSCLLVIAAAVAVDSYLLFSLKQFYLWMEYQWFRRIPNYYFFCVSRLLAHTRLCVFELPKIKTKLSTTIHLLALTHTHTLNVVSVVSAYAPPSNSMISSWAVVFVRLPFGFFFTATAHTPAQDSRQWAKIMFFRFYFAICFRSQNTRDVRVFQSHFSINNMPKNMFFFLWFSSDDDAHCILLFFTRLIANK